MDILDIDIETYSTVDLRKSNVYAYSEDPAFEVLMCGWSLNGSPVEVEIGEPTIKEIPGLWDPHVKKVAHNAGFERVCLSRMYGLPVGEYLPPEDWYDTAAVAAEYGFPRKLETLAKALGAEPKDTAGTRLINLFCKPYRGRRVMPADMPEKWASFIEYNRTDVVVLQDVRRLLPGGWPSEFERNLWYLDQRINDRGIKVDLPLANKAVEAATANTNESRREVIEITGIDNPGSGPQLLRWFDSRNLGITDLQAETVEITLQASTLPPDVRRVLELRQELALAASRKYTAALLGCSIDGRLRGQFKFYGAHTGRWSSTGLQFQNLPRASVDHEEAAIWDLLNDFGASPEALKGLVRPLFLGPFTISDLSGIEARVIAWLAGEQWVLDAVRAGRDLYIEAAKRMGGGMGRPQGKIATLALGYQGSVGSLRAMGYGGREVPYVWGGGQKLHPESGELREVRASMPDEYKTDAELKNLVNKWRRANPNIVRFWARLEKAFRSGSKIGAITVEVEGSTRRIRLPSGRAIHYNGVRTGRRLTYAGNRGPEETYGGSLAENVTQGVARDILADAMLRLEAAGYLIVAHVHDEVVAESDDLDGIKKIMETGPDWSDGLPLDASCDLVMRYTK